MASILQLKRRIQVATNVSKTTRAMQMIAASKLKKGEEAALAARPYVEKLTNLSGTLVKRVDPQDAHEYMKTRKGNDSLLIVISPDKGLCGSLVSNILREILNFEKKGKTYYITVGKKTENFIIRGNQEVVASFPFGTSLPSFEIVPAIVKVIDDYFLKKRVSEVKILSAKFVSIFTQKPIVETLLPINININESQNLASDVMLFEPSLSLLLPDLLQHFLETIIFQNIQEAYASEQAARMIAMQNATDNAREIIKVLQLEYNKKRQEKITNEILDISSATMALSYEE